jgi:glutaredoxin
MPVTICPKCRYVRQAADTAPAWQCPSCGVAYEKAGGAGAPALSAANRPIIYGEPERRSFLGWGIAGVAAAVGAWFALGQRSKPVPEQAKPKPKEVVLFATTWCPYCTAARDLFAAMRLAYTEVDIESGNPRVKEYKAINGRGVPVILVDYGEFSEVINGFDERALRAIPT